MNLSLRETAEKHDINPGYLSQRTREGKPAKGYALYEYAVYGDNGDFSHFNFPPDYVFPDEGPEPEPEALEHPPSNAPNKHVTDSVVAESPSAEATPAEWPTWLTRTEAVEYLRKRVPVRRKAIADDAWPVLVKGATIVNEDVHICVPREKIDRLIQDISKVGWLGAISLLERRTEEEQKEVPDSLREIDELHDRITQALRR